MESTAAQKAITLALQGKWEEAIKINEEILSENKDDIDALNRLARAYGECGKTTKAKEYSLKVLKIDSGNPIAKRCLEKLQTGIKGEKHTPCGINGEAFLEDPGRTKLIPLLNPGGEKILATLNSGDEVKMTTHTHKVSILTNDGKYIGRLPDDLAARIKTLIEKGNKYQLLIKSVGQKDVTIFAREIERGKNVNGTLSFPIEKIEYVSFTSPELINKDS